MYNNLLIQIYNDIKQIRRDKNMLDIGTKVKHYKGVYFEITDKVGEDFYRAQGLRDGQLITNVGSKSIEAGHFTIVSDEEWDKIKNKRKTTNNVRNFPATKGNNLMNTGEDGDEFGNNLDYEEVFENVF